MGCVGVSRCRHSVHHIWLPPGGQQGVWQGLQRPGGHLPQAGARLRPRSLSASIPHVSLPKHLCRAHQTTVWLHLVLAACLWCWSQHHSRCKNTRLHIQTAYQHSTHPSMGQPTKISQRTFSQPPKTSQCTRLYSASALASSCPPTQSTDCQPCLLLPWHGIVKPFVQVYILSTPLIVKQNNINQ